MEACDEKILENLRKAFSNVESYRLEASIIQANAAGYKLLLLPSEERVFYKVVNASDYISTKKDWPDLRRTLMYARTEARFYQQVLPELRKRGFDAVPHVHLAEYHFEGWIEESEAATREFTEETANLDINALEDPCNKGGVLVLDCVSDSTHFQDSPLTLDQCKRCLEAVAKLHASAWQDQVLLEQVDRVLSKASFHLKTRNPKELAGIVEAWDGFYEVFEHPFQVECNLVWTDSLRDLGRRTKAVAHYVSEIVSPKPYDKYATIVHGDYKSMNVFLPRDMDNDQALMVDWASCGIGLGMSDLAMHIHHAVPPQLLANGGEESLVKYYWEQLCSLIQTDYPWELAWMHYKYAVVDYFRFFLARMWKGANPRSFEKKRDNKNVSLINRDIRAACEFMVTVDHFLNAKRMLQMDLRCGMREMNSTQNCNRSNRMPWRLCVENS